MFALLVAMVLILATFRLRFLICGVLFIIIPRLHLAIAKSPRNLFAVVLVGQHINITVGSALAMFNLFIIRILPSMSYSCIIFGGDFMCVYKVSWSGGKDSTAAMLLHLQAGHTVHAVCFVPMLTNDIPLIMPDHFSFIMTTADKFRSMGAVVDIVHGDTYYDHVHRIITRGIHKGLPMGIGLGFGFCLFRNYSKLRAGIFSVKFDFDYEDIGIAFDEYRRKSQLILPKMSILCDKQITERRAFEICIDNGLLSPIYYGTARRDGCAICPNCKTQDFLSWVRAYPGAKDILLDIESFCKKWRPNNSPYRGGVWFSDRLKQEYQYTFSDVETV